MEIDTISVGLDTVRTHTREETGSPRQVSSAMSPSTVTEAQRRALAAKLSLPHQGFVLGRPRLLARVERLREGGVVSLVAGPGYGKTAFIVDLLSAPGMRAVYYAVDGDDRDPHRFFRYLMAGLDLASQAGSAEHGVDWAASSPGDESALDLAAMMVDAISTQARRPTILAIDDLHLVDSSPEVMQAFRLLTRSLPPRWVMLLSSRRRLPMELDDVALGGRLLRLHGRDLRLTPREVAAWARQNWAVTLQPSEARALWRITEGWPAALVLLGQHLLSQRSRVDRNDVIRIMARGSELRAYLEEHVISDLDPAAAQTVLTASLLPRVVFPRDEIFLPGETGEAEAILEEMVSRGFLVTATGRRSFTLHPLLRGFAERELWPAEEQTGLIRRAAAHLEYSGETREAASLYLRAGYFEDAARPLRALAVSSLNVTIDFAHQEWLDLIPEDAVRDQPWLLVARAKVLRQQTEYAEAAALYERAARQLSAAGDKEGLLSVLLGSAFCLFNQGLWDDSLAVLARCRSLAGSLGERIEVLVAEGSVLVSLCRWDEAAENWERALALAPPEMRVTLVPRIHLHRARLFFSMGHYTLGKQWARRSLEAQSGRISLNLALGLNGCAILEYVTGEYDLAQLHVSESLRMCRARGYMFLEVSARLTHAGLALAAGDFRGGLAEVREVQRLAAKAGDLEEVFWAEDMLGDMCRRQKNPRRALEHHRRALDIVDRNRLSLFERVRASTGIGLDLIAMGEEDRGRAALEETVGTSRRWGLDGSLVPSLLYLGWLHARAGREHEAGRSMTEAMRLAAEHEHVHFLVQEAQLALPILALCDRFEVGSFVRERILPRLSVRLQGYFHLLAEGPTYPTDVSLGPPRAAGVSPPLPDMGEGGRLGSELFKGMQALTDREREILKMIALGMPNKVIGAKLFITEKTVKTHANHIFRKLDVSSRLQATLVFQSYQRARKRQPSAGRGRTEVK